MKHQYHAARKIIDLWLAEAGRKSAKFLVWTLLSVLSFSSNAEEPLPSEFANKVAFAEVTKDKNAEQNCQLLTTQEAIKKANRKVEGKIVSIKLEKKGADSVYRVRVLVGNKRIKNLTVKACR
ncbi:PepSY domain-containing protein [Aliikangiella sp. G2MR2-5]|uniref:PepSY domain-containing protein n=1 Tax=Aliikangiella sp. G2MR2-5 TaxID=2788943 RepID=UPI0018A96146|nr:PepSY domain-containing protein [Aliikangiella sp. G2MR2-5]